MLHMMTLKAYHDDMVWFVARELAKRAFIPGVAGALWIFRRGRCY